MPYLQEHRVALNSCSSNIRFSNISNCFRQSCNWTNVKYSFVLSSKLRQNLLNCFN